MPDCSTFRAMPREARSSTSQLLEPIKGPARFQWHEVTKVQHYWLAVDSMTGPMRVREDETPCE